LIVASLLYTSCDLIEPEFDNVLDIQNNDPPALLFSPKEYTASAGEEVAVDLYALEVENVAALQAQILYDKDRLEIVSIGPGTFFDSSDSPLFVTDSSNPGRLDLYSVFLGSSKEVSGTGDLATIVFRVIAAGDAYLEVSGDSELLNRDSQPIALKSLGIGVIRAQ
jgi:hypothetical protein